MPGSRQAPVRRSNQRARTRAVVFGAEALIVTRDVARLDPNEATEVMRWAAATLIRGALAQVATDLPPPPVTPRGRKSNKTGRKRRPPTKADMVPPD